MEQLQACDSLVAICEKSNDAGIELATMAGFALSRGLLVIWIGPVVRALAGFRAVQQFDSAHEFCTEILRRVYSPSLDSVSERLVA